MKSNGLPVWAGAIGCLLSVPWILWHAGPATHLSKNDEAVALRPLLQIPLDQGPVRATFTVPQSPTWRRIRKVWGEPEFVISEVSRTAMFALCLPDMPLRIELNDTNGSMIPFHRGRAPYGYSDDCAQSSLRFNAEFGTEVEIRVAGTATEGTSIAKLIVIADWFGTKDKIVGDVLNKDIGSILTGLFAFGLMLVLAAACVFTANRIRQRRH